MAISSYNMLVNAEHGVVERSSVCQCCCNRILTSADCLSRPAGLGTAEPWTVQKLSAAFYLSAVFSLLQLSPLHHPSFSSCRIPTSRIQINPYTLTMSLAAVSRPLASRMLSQRLPLAAASRRAVPAFPRGSIRSFSRSSQCAHSRNENPQCVLWSRN